LKRPSIPLFGLSALLVLACSLLFVPLPAEWSAGWRGECLNRLHAPLMGACLVLIAALFHLSGCPRGASLKRAAVSATGMAVLVELVQPWFHRTASLEDLGWGMAGVLAGVLWMGAGLLKAAWTRAMLRLLAVICVLTPPLEWLAQAALARAEADRLFPVLAGVSKTQRRLFWSIGPGNRVSDHPGEDPDEMILARDPDHAASVHLNTLGRDWNGFSGLEIDGTLEAPSAVEIGVRVDLDDAEGRRLRVGGRMQPGRSRIQIVWPHGNLPRKVRQLVVFLAAEDPPARLWLHELRLIRNKNASGP